MSILLLVVGLLLFISLVVVHEFGHFIVARRNGVEVEEFAIFFPPRLYKRVTKAGWLFSINLLPLGGYVKLKGEHDSDTKKGTFGAASLWVKSKIMAAGVAMNLLAALVVFTLLAIIGMPQLVPNQFTVKSDTHIVNQNRTEVVINQVIPGSPAAKAGLKQNDQVTAIGSTKISVASDLQAAAKHYAGQTVQLQYERNHHTYTTIATLNSAAMVAASSHTKQPKVYLGIGFGDEGSDITLQRSTWSAPIVAVGLAKQLTVLTFKGLGSAVGGAGSFLAGLTTHNHAAKEHGLSSASKQVGGPIAIFIILRDGSSLGWNFMLLIIAYISLTLAVVNILPIPALDGGRLWITLIAHAIKRPLSAHLEETINAAGFAFLMLIFALLIFNDIHNIHHLLNG
jgi:regulator of sigma E protease